MKRILGSVLLVLAVISATAADYPQWRGPNRDGMSAETGLLKQWPAEGPKQLWKSTDVGSGYAAPSVVGSRIYLLGNEGLENEFVQALELSSGKRVWSTRLGVVGNPEQKPNFPAARSTPTVVGEVLYALSSDGVLACVEISGGKIKWQKNIRQEFAGKPGTWAYSESPLVDGESVVCTPGGAQATIVGLNRTTGEVLWKCALPEADEAAYSSPILFQTAGSRQYVQLLQKGLVGVEAGTGKFLWRYGKPVSAFNANIPSPLAADGLIYVGSAGTGGGAARISKAADGSFSAEQVYFNAKLPTAIGGAVKIGNYLYGTSSSGMLCLDFASGEIKWQERALGAASICSADGLLFLHGENGEVALVEPSAEAYREKGRFTPSDAPKHANMEKSWAYPVVASGKLLIRDHGHLWCYTVTR